MAYMIAAYLIIWAAAFGFIITMVRRQSGIQNEIAALRELVADRKERR